MEIYKLMNKHDKDLLLSYTPHQAVLSSLSLFFQNSPRREYTKEQSTKVCINLQEMAIDLFAPKQELNDEMLGILYFTLIDFCEISIECVMQVFSVSEKEINDKKMILDTPYFLENIGLLDTLKFFLFFVDNYELKSFKH